MAVSLSSVAHGAEHVIGGVVAGWRSHADAPSFDVRHIIEGDATGGRHLAIPGVDPGVVAKRAVHPWHTWCAKVTVDGATKLSTMFPVEWTVDDVRQAALDVVAHPAAIRFIPQEPALRALEGSPHGIPMRVVFDDEQNQVVSAFPTKPNQLDDRHLDEVGTATTASASRAAAANAARVAEHLDRTAAARTATGGFAANWG